MKYTTEQIEAIAIKLRGMPPVEKKKQEHSRQEVVGMLSKEITAMQKRGYTLDQISEALRGEGLAVATPTLKSYLQRAKPAGRKVPDRASGRTPAAENGSAQQPVARKTVDALKATFTPKSDSSEI